MVTFKEKKHTTYTVGPISPYRMREIMSETLDTTFKPMLKGSVFNTAVTANIDIFDEDLAPTNTPTTFRIYACFDAAGVLTVRRTSGGVTVSEQLNAGAALALNAAYMFDILIGSEGETINLQYSVSATCLYLTVVEVPSVIS